MKYYVIWSKKLSDLESYVNKHIIEDGWIPQGGICVMPNEIGIIKYYQAMIVPKQEGGPI